MAQEWATGGVHIFVRGNTSNGGNKKTAPILYLGTAEQAPSIQTDRTFKQVMNDLSSQKPFDYVYAGGSEAILSFVLTRYEEPAATLLEQAPISGGLGFETIFDQGSIMGQEGLTLDIWYLYTFGGLAASPSMTGQEAGRHYVQALFWGPDTHSLGTQERKKHFVFKCFKKYDPTQNPPRFTLWDTNMQGLPPLA